MVHTLPQPSLEGLAQPSKSTAKTPDLPLPHGVIHPTPHDGCGTELAVPQAVAPFDPTASQDTLPNLPPPRIGFSAPPGKDRED